MYVCNRVSVRISRAPIASLTTTSCEGQTRFLTFSPPFKSISIEQFYRSTIALAERVHAAVVWAVVLPCAGDRKEEVRTSRMWVADDDDNYTMQLLWYWMVFCIFYLIREYSLWVQRHGYGYHRGAARTVCIQLCGYSVQGRLICTLHACTYRTIFLFRFFIFIFPNRCCSNSPLW